MKKIMQYLVVSFVAVVMMACVPAETFLKPYAENRTYNVIEEEVCIGVSDTHENLKEVCKMPKAAKLELFTDGTFKADASAGFMSEKTGTTVHTSGKYLVLPSGFVIQTNDGHYVNVFVSGMAEDKDSGEMLDVIETRRWALAK